MKIENASALVDPETGTAVPTNRIQLRPGPAVDDRVRHFLNNLATGAAR